MTKMKSFRLKGYTLQMLKELYELDKLNRSETAIIEHAIWEYYEIIFRKKVGGNELRELEKKWKDNQKS